MEQNERECKGRMQLVHHGQKVPNALVQDPELSLAIRQSDARAFVAKMVLRWPELSISRAKMLAPYLAINLGGSERFATKCHRVRLLWAEIESLGRTTTAGETERMAIRLYEASNTTKQPEMNPAYFEKVRA